MNDTENGQNASYFSAAQGFALAQHHYWHREASSDVSVDEIDLKQKHSVESSLYLSRKASLEKLYGVERRALPKSTETNPGLNPTIVWSVKVVAETSDDGHGRKYEGHAQDGCKEFETCGSEGAAQAPDDELTRQVEGEDAE